MVDWEQKKWILIKLLCAKDTALTACLFEQVQGLVREFGRVCERMGLVMSLKKNYVTEKERARTPRGS